MYICRLHVEDRYGDDKVRGFHNFMSIGINLNLSLKIRTMGSETALLGRLDVEIHSITERGKVHYPKRSSLK